jgi:hypothetical protein
MRSGQRFLRSVHAHLALDPFPKIRTQHLSHLWHLRTQPRVPLGTRAQINLHTDGVDLTTDGPEMIARDNGIETAVSVTGPAGSAPA